MINEERIKLNDVRMRNKIQTDPTRVINFVFNFIFYHRFKNAFKKINRLSI